MLRAVRSAAVIRIVPKPYINLGIIYIQLAVKSKKSHSWFILVSEILEQYGLPSSHDLLPNPSGKLSWKNTVSNKYVAASEVLSGRC
jgi:hypothetical protein